MDLSRTRPPRVAFVCGNVDPARDGVADYTVRLAAALADRADRADPVIVTAGPVGRDAPGVLRAAAGWGPRGLGAVARALRRVRPDVVHVQFAPSAYGFSPAVGLLPRLLPAGTPLVTTLHEYGWWCWPARLPTRAWPPLERSGRWDRETLALVPGSSRLVVTNPAHAAVLAERFGRSALTVPVGANVPTPAGPREPAALVRRRHGVPAAATVLVFFGFVHPVKGVQYLYDALAELRPERPDLHVVVAGGFTSLALPAGEAAAFRAELAGHAARAGVAGAVTVTGHLPAGEVSALLGAADVAVLPFTAGVTAKSGSLVAVLAHGLPTVLTAAHPPDPALVDGCTAVVVDRVRDGAALAAGIRRVLGDDVLRARIAAAGRRLVADRDWPGIADTHLRLYAELTGTLRPAVSR